MDPGSSAYREDVGGYQNNVGKSPYGSTAVLNLRGPRTQFPDPALVPSQPFDYCLTIV